VFCSIITKQDQHPRLFHSHCEYLQSVRTAATALVLLHVMYYNSYYEVGQDWRIRSLTIWRVCPLSFTLIPFFIHDLPLVVPDSLSSKFSRGREGEKRPYQHRHFVEMMLNLLHCSNTAVLVPRDSFDPDNIKARWYTFLSHFYPPPIMLSSTWTFQNTFPHRGHEHIFLSPQLFFMASPS
jgi:hypothetical protein